MSTETTQATTETDISITAAPAGAPAAAAATTAAPADKSWIESLPDDIKSDPSLSVFKDPAALAKSWVSAQKMIGADKVVIPGEKSLPEEWDTFYKKMGRPEAAEKYELPKVEGVEVEESMAKGFKEVAFKAGLNPKQVAEIFSWYGKDAKALVESRSATEQQTTKQAIEEFQKEVGGKEKMAVVVDKARQAVRLLADETMIKFLDSSGLGNKPEMIKFFASLAERMGEGSLKGPAGASPGMGAAEIQAKINSIYANPAMHDAQHPMHNSLVQEASKLFGELTALSNKTA